MHATFAKESQAMRDLCHNDIDVTSGPGHRGRNANWAVEMAIFAYAKPWTVPKTPPATLQTTVHRFENWQQKLWAWPVVWHNK